MFVEICRLIMQLYSKNFFKMYFYQSIIKLAHDPVVNVRISFIKILPDLKRIWRLQNDREKLENLEMIARNFFHDRDKDVFELAQKVNLKFKFFPLIFLILSGQPFKFFQTKRQ